MKGQHGFEYQSEEDAIKEMHQNSLIMLVLIVIFSFLIYFFK